MSASWRQSFDGTFYVPQTFWNFLDGLGGVVHRSLENNEWELTRAGIHFTCRGKKEGKRERNLQTGAHILRMTCVCLNFRHHLALWQCVLSLVLVVHIRHPYVYSTLYYTGVRLSYTNISTGCTKACTCSPKALKSTFLDFYEYVMNL